MQRREKKRTARYIHTRFDKKKQMTVVKKDTRTDIDVSIIDFFFFKLRIALVKENEK
jgi:hypothetical protein